jgi:hypothetical protein
MEVYMAKRGKPAVPFAERLSLDPDTGCLNWTAGKIWSGYGRVRIGRVLKLAHRHAYELEKGPPPKGKLVLHTCDNPACCNVGHLYLGDQFDNMRDRSARKRNPNNGTRNPANKLSDDQVMAIRKAYAEGRMQIDLAKDYGVTQPMISQIVLRKKWQHVP